MLTLPLHEQARAATIRRVVLVLACGAVAFGAAFTALAGPALAAGDYGPDTCLEGWVWRDAVPGDHVCVTGATRSQAAYDNSQAAARRSPAGGPYGPDTCLFGYVWREATAGDHVCVTGATRSQAWADNGQASARRDSLTVWHDTYTIPPQCNGGICTSTSTDDIPRFHLHADHVNVGWVTVELRRLDTGALRRSWLVYAPAAGYTPGGRLNLKTGVFDCRRAADSYFTIRDPSSTRLSARHYVSSICAVL
jgi:hypothetical protein